VVDGQFSQHRRANRPRHVPSHRRVQVGNGDPASGHRRNAVQREVGPFAGPRVTAVVADEHVGKRANLGWLVVIARRLDPRVLPVLIEVRVLGFRRSLPRMLRLTAAVPRRVRGLR
jgi:hypothetical protein